MYHLREIEYKGYQLKYTHKIPKLSLQRGRAYLNEISDSITAVKPLSLRTVGLWVRRFSAERKEIFRVRKEIFLIPVISLIVRLRIENLVYLRRH